MNPRKCKDTYFILPNKYHSIYEDIFAAKIIRDDFTLKVNYKKRTFYQSEIEKWIQTISLQKPGL